MQVKKFESDSLRGAIEMVKNEMGPDAVILSTREVARGILAKPHVLVTAAISETKLRQKKFAEKKLGAHNLDKFRKNSAVNQRQVIDKIYGNVTEKIEEKRKAISKRPYISITDDELVPVAAIPKVEKENAGSHVLQVAGVFSNLSVDRIKSAAKEAFKANVFTDEAKIKSSVTQNLISPQIGELKSEIQRLQSLIRGMDKKENNVYPKTMHPGAKYGLPFELSAMFEKLRKQGVHEQLVVTVLKKMMTQFSDDQLSQPRIVDAYIAKWLLSTTSTVSHEDQERLEFFFGPTGSGKTASLVKVASNYVVNHKKKIAIITTDNLKVGASEQLRIYSQILNVPFATVKNGAELDQVVGQLRHVDRILIDTPGLSLKGIDELNWTRNLLASSTELKSSHLVLSALSNDEDLISIAKRFCVTNFSNLIVTNLDQVSRHGVLVNLNKILGKPLFSFGTGSRIPEDMEWASKERVLDLIFKLSKVNKEGK